MPEDHGRPDPTAAQSSARAVGAVGLAAVAVVHVVDLPDTVKVTPLVGSGYVLLIGAALLTALLLVGVPDRRVWLLVDLVAVAALGGYVLSRTTGLPTDSVDIGNWDCALGTTAISTETLLVVLALWQLLQHPAPDGPSGLEAYDAVPTPRRGGPPEPG
jgi:hypothetical protein